MSHEDTQEERKSLGTFLREHREQKGASLAEASEATKISSSILQAMEDDAHDLLPAEAFSRGFYSLYATFLEINPKEVLDRHEVEKGPEERSLKIPAKPPIKKSKRFSNYAEPSSISPGTSMGIFIIICIILIAGLCWYFNWNPTNYFNNNSLLDPGTSTSQEQTASPTREYTQNPAQHPAAGATPESAAGVNDNSIMAPDEAPLVSAGEEKTPSVKQSAETTDSPHAATPYQLEIYFNNNGTLKVALDAGFVLDKHYNEGETLQWEVEKKIILDMPENISGVLRLNGIEIPLPEAKNGRRMLSLPEDLLN